MVNANIGLVLLPNSGTRSHLCVHVFEYVCAFVLCCCGTDVIANFTSILGTEVGQGILLGSHYLNAVVIKKKEILYQQNMIVLVFLYRYLWVAFPLSVYP